MRRKAKLFALCFGLIGPACRGEPEPASMPAVLPSTASSVAPSAAPTAAPASAAALPKYAEARAAFATRLKRQGPAPQPFEPVAPPKGVTEVVYRSGALELKAWLAGVSPEGKKRPAVLFLHGGFAFGVEDWEMAAPFRDAGFVVMVPLVRGENGMPGHFTMFLAEVDDVLAAAESLAAHPAVLPDRIYLAGHSAGGTLTALAAMASGRFRAAAAYSASPDQRIWREASPAAVPFDLNDGQEYALRSPAAFPTSFQCPIRLFYGSQEQPYGRLTERLAERAKAAGLDVRAIALPGDHFSYVPEAMRQSISFFDEHRP
ncbi:alpha/beta fold hydrolase [Myxococcota bacterium]|nr:alpha/beta fold hydrolase [Myxococcota bacterium]